MLTVGRKLERAGAGTGPVYECPRCGYHTAGMFAYDRLAPTRQTPPGGI
jgi:hypothetical protein